MANRTKIGVVLDGGAGAHPDDLGFPDMSIVGSVIGHSRMKITFRCHLGSKVELEEFNNFLEVTNFALQGKTITVIVNGEFVNGSYPIAIGDANSNRFFWTALESPDGKSRFLTDEEVSELLRDL